MNIQTILSKGKKFVRDPYYRLKTMIKLGFYDSLNDEEFLRKIFQKYQGYPLDLENPKTFNEKMQWMKLHDRQPEYITMVDKHEAKHYLADRIDSKYIIPTLGVWNSFDDIDFD